MIRQGSPRSVSRFPAVAVVGLGGPSNERCVSGGEGQLPEQRASDVAQHLLAASRGGAKMVVFAGGEVTLRRDLIGLVRRARAWNLEVGLCTNARLLIYTKLRHRLLAQEIAYWRVTLHGPTAEIHDQLVGVPGAFAQGQAALIALLEEAPPAAQIEIACTLTTINLRHLDALVDLIGGLPRRGRLVRLRLAAPLGGRPRKLWPSTSAAVDAVGQALKRAGALSPRLDAVWEGYPPCLLAAHADQRSDELRTARATFGPLDGCTALPHETDTTRRYPLACSECLRVESCPGAPARFLQDEGEAALLPVRGVQPNSFNFEHQHDIAGTITCGEACPAWSLTLGGDRRRYLLLAGQDHLGLYYSPTRDFSERTIGVVKDDLQQLFLDTSRQAAVGQRSREIQRLRQHPACTACARHRRCPGAVIAAPDSAFVAEERWLRHALGGLRGRVLDVGCGRLPYHEEFSALVAESLVEYHGLDPDEDALACARLRAPLGTAHPARIEEFRCPDAHYSAVIALRSVNHIQDLPRAFYNIARALRVGGQLLLSDSTIFGLLRTPLQVARADASPAAGHEHYRNWTSTQMLDFLRGQPFQMIRHRPITAATGNEWFLQLERSP